MFLHPFSSRLPPLIRNLIPSDIWPKYSVRNLHPPTYTAGHSGTSTRLLSFVRSFIIINRWPSNPRVSYISMSCQLVTSLKTQTQGHEVAKIRPLDQGSFNWNWFTHLPPVPLSEKRNIHALLLIACCGKSARNLTEISRMKLAILQPTKKFIKPILVKNKTNFLRKNVFEINLISCVLYSQ